MSRKISFAASIAVILSLLLASVALARGDGPGWEVVFDPATDSGGEWLQPNYTIMAVEPFKGKLYAAVGNAWVVDGEVQVYRSSDGKRWEAASEPGLGTADYFVGDMQVTLPGSMDMIVFRDKLFIVLMSNSTLLRPSVILSSANGTTWTPVADTGELGLAFDYEGSTLYGQFHHFAIFHGMLYVGVDYFDVGEAQWTAGSVYRSATGEPGSWEKVANFPNWNWVGSFAEFKGALYIASDGVVNSPDFSTYVDEEVWRTYDGVNWEKVVTVPFSSAGIGGMARFEKYLYLGGAVLWRSKDGLHWEEVTSLTPLLAENDLKIDGMAAHHGQFYVWTVNYAEGGSVFRSRDGKHWERVNQPGWTELGVAPGEYLTSHFTTAQAEFRGDLYLGIFGPHGPLLKLVERGKR